MGNVGYAQSRVTHPEPPTSDYSFRRTLLGISLDWGNGNSDPVWRVGGSLRLPDRVVQVIVRIQTRLGQEEVRIVPLEGQEEVTGE